jgi:hypothetical protein
MKKIYTLILTGMLCSISYADDITMKFTYENFNFENSKKKDNGKRFDTLIDYKTDNTLYQFMYEKTDTDTFKPPLTKNLHVNKYYLKYSYKIGNKDVFTASYASIDDNIMKETDGGHIYGLGYKNGMFGLNQYFSDYENFNVYQTDLKYTFRKAFGEMKTSATLLGKYIHLQDKNSNDFSANAQEDYFTPGIKIHTHYKDYHLGAGAFFGKRAFAVMNDGFRIQHHAMEFDETYMFGLGKHFTDLDVNLRYIYQKATELPINNDDVKVKNITIQIGYHFN